MHCFHNSVRVIALSGLLFSLGACAADSTTATPAGTPALVVRGSGAPATASLMDGPPAGWQVGAASSLTIKLYALYISANADCSNPVLVQDLGASGADRDFLTNPVLFSGTPPDGSYQCVMMQMSDVPRARPAASFGGCVAGTEYSGDIYRTGDSGWVDVNLSPIVGTGTDLVPVDSHVTIFVTRDAAAAMGRGISINQILQLQSNLIVPGQTTFHMDASSSVSTNGVLCGIEKPTMSFQ